jgi:hypothetical protein
VLPDLHGLRAPSSRLGQRQGVQRGAKHSKETSGRVGCRQTDSPNLEAALTVYLQRLPALAEQKKGYRPLRHYSELSASFTKREITEASVSKCVVMIPR